MFNIPLHPALVHIPLGLSVIMPFLVGLMWFLTHKNWLPKKSWLIIIALQATIFGSGILAMETGEQDEEVVERVVSEEIIKDHEEMAETFVKISGVLTLLLLSLIAAPKKYENLAKAGSLLAVTLNLLLAANVGHSGGELIYKHGAASAHVSNNSGQTTENQDKDQIDKNKTTDNDDDD